MSRVRVIRDGKVIGSLPSASESGYAGGFAAHYRVDVPVPAPYSAYNISMPYLHYWLDEAGDPVGNAGYPIGSAETWMYQNSPAPSFRIEIFLSSDRVEPELLARVPGWEAVRPKRIINLGPVLR